MMCEFGANAQTESCQQICADRGGECLDAFNNQGQCGHGSQLSCSTTNFDSVICVCSRGCGGGPACGAAQTCANGMCG